MSIKLAIAGGQPFEVHDEVITLGSDPSCAVKFPPSPEIKPKHAVIRSIAGRWLIEVREGDAIFVGGPEPRRLQWLSPGDEIRLFEHCPVVVFQPTEVSVTMFSDGNPSIKTMSKTAKPPSSSSGSVPVRNPPPLPAPSPNSSGTIPVSVSGFHSASDTSAISSTAPRPIVTSSQIPANRVAPKKVADEEPVARVPKTRKSSPEIKKLSSIVDENYGEPRRTTMDQQELRWIMTIVGRIVGAGLALILVWIVVSWIANSFAPEAINSLLLPEEIRIG